MKDTQAPRIDDIYGQASMKTTVLPSIRPNITIVQTDSRNSIKTTSRAEAIRNGQYTGLPDPIIYIRTIPFIEQTQ